MGVKALQRGGQQSVDSMRRVSTKLRFFGLLLRWLLLRQLLAHPDSLFHLGLAQPRCLTPLSCSQTPRFLSFPYYYYYYYFLIHRSISFSTLQVLYYLLFLNVVWLLICGVWFSIEILIVFWVFILFYFNSLMYICFHTFIYAALDGSVVKFWLFSVFFFF